MIRKGMVLLALTLMLGFSPVWAEKGDITAFGGWQFGGSIKTSVGTLKIKDNWNFGAVLDLSIRPGIQLELSYSRMESEVNLKTTLQPSVHLFDAVVEYFHIGALRVLRPGKVQPYTSFTIGMTHFNPKAANISSEWRFSMNLGLGVKIFPSERIGLRLQGRLMMPIINSGAGFWWGPGGGYVTVGGEVMLQGDLTAGLIIRF